MIPYRSLSKRSNQSRYTFERYGTTKVIRQAKRPISAVTFSLPFSKSSIAQVLASWFRKDARRGICDCPSCSGLDANVTDNLLHNLHFGGFGLSLFSSLSCLRFASVAFIKVSLLKSASLNFWMVHLHLHFYMQACCSSGSYRFFDRLLPQDFSLRTIDKIAFGIPHEVSFKSLGTHLLGSHLQYSRLCYIRSVLLDLYNLCIG